MKIKSILVGIWVLIILPTMTYALFVDTVTSQGNTFSAATLSTQMLPTTITEEISFEGDVDFTITLQNIGQLTTQNSLSITDISNTDFAEKINVIATLDGTTTLYEGRLDEFSVDSNPYLDQTTSDSNLINFTFSISEDNLVEESVIFSIHNHAWQTNMPQGQGFSSDQSVRVTLTSTTTTESENSTTTESQNLELFPQLIKPEEENETNVFYRPDFNLEEKESET